MTKMEIASHLAIIGVAMAESKRGDATFEKTLQAVREAQMILYSLALTEIAEQLKEQEEER